VSTLRYIARIGFTYGHIKFKAGDVVPTSIGLLLERYGAMYVTTQTPTAEGTQP
jgi:hypothetical protein